MRYKIHKIQPLSLQHAEDAGSGGGAGFGGGDSSSSRPDAGGRTGAGDQRDQRGTAAAFRLSDDALVDLGDGKPVKWSEARGSRFVPREEHQAYLDRYQRGVDFLTSQAKILDQMQQGQRRQPQQTQDRVEAQRSAGVNIDDISGMPIVDGATLAKMAREMQTTQLAPLGAALAQIATRMQAMEKQLGDVRGATGTLAEEHSAKEFDTLYTRTMKTLPEIKGLKGPIPADDPTVRELFDDVYLSYDQRDPTLRKEIGTMVAKRFEGFVALVRKMDKAAAEQAQTNRRKFPAFNRGTGQGSGARGYQHLSGADLARSFFHGSDDA